MKRGQPNNGKLNLSCHRGPNHLFLSPRFLPNWIYSCKYISLKLWDCYELKLTQSNERPMTPPAPT